MSVYDISYYYESDTKKITDITLFPHWGYPPLIKEVVWQNWKIVDGIFDHRKSYYSVRNNMNVFPDRKSYWLLENHHAMLREMCALWSKEMGKVSSLIQWFTITDENGVAYEISADEDPLNPALLVYWLAEGRDYFTLDSTTTMVVKSYFSEEFNYINSLEWQKSDKDDKNYQFLRLLMQEGNAIRVSR